jgi:hypothetical protein
MRMSTRSVLLTLVRKRSGLLTPYLAKQGMRSAWPETPFVWW